MKTLTKWTGWLCALALLAACQSGGAASTSQPAQPQQAYPAPATQASEAYPAPASSLSPRPTAAPTTVAPAASAAPADLQLSVVAPVDGAVVNTPEVEVTGRAVPGTVVSLDDVIVLVDGTSQFTARVPLVEGLNVIEIVASGPDGNETTTELAVTYTP